ncbi:MAG: DUF2959 domain-containing protein [Planctomycetota bacterium]|nr:DUF2959 domain-containing protein [Planctomycetota bacterium]
MNLKRLFQIGCVGLVLVSGCSTVYYKAWQKLGYEKRDILVSRVETGKQDQKAAEGQFKTTMQKFQELTKFNGGDLEAEYGKLNSSYESCVARADDVSKNIKSIDSVATDMFAEWDTELGQYDNPDLKAKSQEELNQTREKYKQLISLMRKSEASMQPVLRAFHDQVLFMKHNLNAAAINSLQSTAAGIDTDVQKLIADMEASINEADSFLSKVKS